MKPKTPIETLSQSVEYPSKKSKQDDAGGRVFLDGGLKAGYGFQNSSAWVSFSLVRLFWTSKRNE